MKNLTGSLVWRGVLALVIGVLAVAWPGITIGAFVILFSVYAFIAAGIEAVGAFGADGAGSVVWGLLLAGLDVAAGIVALAWPGITALAIVWLIAFWAFIGGAVELAMAIAAGESAGERALFGLGGLLSIALGVVFAIRPDVGAVTISQVYGLFSIFAGISALVMAANLRENRAAIEFAGL